MKSPWAKKSKPTKQTEPLPVPASHVAPPPPLAPKPAPTFDELVQKVIDERKEVQPMIAKRFIDATLAKPECFERYRRKADEWYQEEQKATEDLVRRENPDISLKQLKKLSVPKVSRGYLIGRVIADEAQDIAAGIAHGIIPMPARPEPVNASETPSSTDDADSAIDLSRPDDAAKVEEPANAGALAAAAG